VGSEVTRYARQLSTLIDGLRDAPRICATFEAIRRHVRVRGMFIISATSDLLQMPTPIVPVALSPSGFTRCQADLIDMLMATVASVAALAATRARRLRVSAALLPAGEARAIVERCAVLLEHTRAELLRGVAAIVEFA
jgi:hypothetical protein